MDKDKQLELRIQNKKAKSYYEDLQQSIRTGIIHVSPLTASLAVNYWCNSKCSYCVIWKNQEKNHDLEDLKFAARQLKEIGIRFVSLGGGEPFLHPKLAELISYLVDP